MFQSSFDHLHKENINIIHKIIGDTQNRLEFLPWIQVVLLFRNMQDRFFITQIFLIRFTFIIIFCITVFKLYSIYFFQLFFVVWLSVYFSVSLILCIIIKSTLLKSNYAHELTAYNIDIESIIHLCCQ